MLNNDKYLQKVQMKKVIYLFRNAEKPSRYFFREVKT